MNKVGLTKDGEANEEGAPWFIAVPSVCFGIVTQTSYVSLLTMGFGSNAGGSKYTYTYAYI